MSIRAYFDIVNLNIFLRLGDKTCFKTLQCTYKLDYGKCALFRWMRTIFRYSKACLRHWKKSSKARIKNKHKQDKHAIFKVGVSKTCFCIYNLLAYYSRDKKIKIHSSYIKNSLNGLGIIAIAFDRSCANIMLNIYVQLHANMELSSFDRQLQEPMRAQSYQLSFRNVLHLLVLHHCFRLVCCLK